MNRQISAYELANAIEEAMVDGFAFGYISEAVVMLRKLQAENDALKATVKRFENTLQESVSQKFWQDLNGKV